nr:hypothetical protein [Gammaproteobacteria bacterium]
MRTALVGCSVAAVIHSFALPAAAQETGTAGLEEVVVTAQRREETAQRAAVALTAVTGDALTQASVTQATDLTRLVPSIQVAPASSLTQIYLRGVGTFAANAFAEQGVAFNLNGVYLSRPAAPAGMFYDLERIEVLKGPQGTLYGRNATGGAVNVIAARPVIGETSGFIHTELGNYDTVKSSAAINVAVNDTAAFRFSGQYVERDGYFNDGYDDEDSHAARAQFRLDNAAVDFSIMADYAHIGGKGVGGTIMPLLAGEERLGPSDPRVIAEYLTRVPTPPVPQIFARDDGYYTTDTEPLRSDGYAIVTDPVDLSPTGGFDAGDVGASLRLAVEGADGEPVFVGVGPAADVAAFLGGAGHTVLDDWNGSGFDEWGGELDYEQVAGGRLRSPPGSEDFWAASSEGAGEQVLEWDVAGGTWTLLVANADASRPVAVEAEAGLRLGWLVWVGVGLTVLGLLIT